MKKAINIFENMGTELDQIINGKKGKPDASFASASDYISSFNQGFSVSGRRFLTLDASRKNCITIAASGLGKSQVQVIPTLLNKNNDSSMIVTDNSGELSQAIPFLQSQGLKCHVFDVTKQLGVYLNPLDGCRDITDYRRIAQSLASFTSAEKDFFTSSAKDLIALFIQYLCESESKIYTNLANLYRLILEYQGQPSRIETLFARRAGDEVWVKFKALCGNSERTLKSITATALSILSWIESPVLANLTSTSTFSWEDFRKTRHALFITNPPSDAEFYAPIISLVFESLYRHVFQSLPKSTDLDILCIMDEFSTYAHGLPNYSQIISNSRKYRLPQSIFLQDISQLSMYKELSKNILMNCFTKIYYGGMSGEQAHELERLLGTKTYNDKEGRKQTAPLMSAQELREMNGKILVVPSGSAPYRTSITPAYKQRKFRKRMVMQAVELLQEENEPIVEFHVQYIDLKPFTENKQKQTKNPNYATDDN